MNSARGARLKNKKIIIIKKLKKKKPDADVGSAKHASQTHPKDVVFFISFFFFKLVKVYIFVSKKLKTLETVDIKIN